MINWKQSRLKEELKGVEARIEQLRARLDRPFDDPDQPDSTTNNELSRLGFPEEYVRGYERARAAAKATMYRLEGPEGRKARVQTDLWLAIEQSERLQLALERVDALRFALFKSFVGDSLQFAITLGVLRWLLGISWGYSIFVALVITVLISLLYEQVKKSQRILEIVVLERAERISEHEGISLAEAQRRVEDLRWP